MKHIHTWHCRGGIYGCPLEGEIPDGYERIKMLQVARRNMKRDWLVEFAAWAIIICVVALGLWYMHK